MTAIGAHRPHGRQLILMTVCSLDMFEADLGTIEALMLQCCLA